MYSAFFKKTVPLPHFDLNKWSQISKILHLFSETPFKTHTSFQDQLLLLYNISLNCPLKSFNNLGHFFDENPVIATNFLVLTLPYIANLALELPKLFPKPINFLLQDQETSQTFTKKQIACLLVHMFFGTITKQDQNPNFQNLLNFQRFLTQKNEVLYEKLHCLFNYFTRLQSNLIDFSLNVSYVRLKKDLKTMQDWQKSKRNLLDVMILDEGGIEDFYPNTIQVDFANSFIGGGALLECCVQEEIRFIISPECFPSMILFECFQDFEVGYIIGAEQFCKYKGYGMNFAYDGDFRDLQPKFDGKHRMDVNILALDAICFYGEGQFEEGFLLRELNKAFIGFKGDDELLGFETKKQWIATGRWGCGAFNGNPQLKFILQWLAASESDKNMIFYRREDYALKHLEKIVQGLNGKNVGEVLQILNSFRKNNGPDLFKFILKEYIKE